MELNAEQEVALATLREGVEQSVLHYFKKHGLQSPGNLYHFALGEFEKPLIRTVLNFVKGNQSLAAILMGVSRGTLRKKMKQYSMLE
jgi:Fis family transcriptional regulator